MAAGVQPNGSVRLPSVTLGNEASARQNWYMAGVAYGQMEDTAKPGCGPFPPQLGEMPRRTRNNSRGA